MKKAESLREESKHKKLTSERIQQILSGNLSTKSKSDSSYKITASIYQKYFRKDQSKKEVEDIIDHALSEYFEHQGWKNK